MSCKAFFFRSLPLAVLVLLLIGGAGCNRKKPVNTVQTLESAYQQAIGGNWNKALELSTQAAETDPQNISALLMLGICQENSGQSAAALQTFKKAADQDPTNPSALYHLGRLLFQQKRYEDSLSPLREAEKLAPANENIQALLAQVQEKLGLPAAFEYYKKLAAGSNFSNRAGVWNQLGIFYAASRDQRNALKALLQAYQLTPDDHMICLNLATYLDYYMNSPASRAKAIQFYKKYLALTRLNPEFKPQRDKATARIKALAVR